MYLTKDCFGGKTQKGRTVVLFSSSSSVIGNKFFNEITAAFPAIELHRVDIDKERDLAADLNIRITPIVYVYQEGNLENSFNYTQKDDLLWLLKSWTA